MTTQLGIRIALALACSAVAVQAGAAETGASAASQRAAAPVSARHLADRQRPKPGQPVIVRASRGDGFHWRDAAIGAIGATGLIVLVGALALGARGKGDRGVFPERRSMR